MRWVPDTTGRFAQRPHYDPGELDGQCERTITGFLRKRHGLVRFPIDTNDLVNLVDSKAKDFDIYADLSNEGSDVQGVTYFNPQGKPNVKISASLAKEPWASHRFRTTLTHELGHVDFHNALWPKAPRVDLFHTPTGASQDVSPRCKRDAILSAAYADWMEWQAGYACGAFLMPITYLTEAVRDWRTGQRVPGGPLLVGSEAGLQLVGHIESVFDVSGDAARVRLTQLRYLTYQVTQTTSLF